MLTTPQFMERVGELAAIHPSVARVLENVGIEYCCSGKRTLAEACAAKRLNPALVAALIEHACAADLMAERNWTKATMTELADHIQDVHHAFVRREFPRLEALLGKVVHAHGERLPEVVEAAEVFTELKGPLLEHLDKEEAILFPALRSMEAPHAESRFEWLADGPLANLMSEHEHAGRALARIRELLHDYRVPPNACTTHRVLLASLETFEADLHLHVHKENNILFPKALRLLGVPS